MPIKKKYCIEVKKSVLDNISKRAGKS